MKINDRINKLRQKLTQNGIDAIFISQPENRYYLSGFNGSSGYLFITQKKMVLATDFRYVEQVKRQAPEYTLFQITGSSDKWFPNLVEGLDIKALGFEATDMSFDFYKNLSNIVNKAGLKLQLTPITGIVESIRAVKDLEEIEFIKRAVKISDTAFKHIKDIIQPGMTELELAWELEKTMREGGSQSMPFEIIVGSGPNSALPHAQPSQRIILNREPVVFDFGARVEGYCSDITRTLCLSKPDDTFNKIYKIVLDAQMAAISQIVDGVTGAQADRFARSVIEEAGYGEAFGHSLGHSLGLAAHEKPNLNKISEDILTENMVFTVEPGIYIPGWGGVRIEDTVLIKNGKISVLSQSVK
jgi:Xaa-Pro aminopeptidase